MQNTLYCKVLQCPYNRNNVCLSDFIFIDPNGMCQHVWVNGQQRPDWMNPERAIYRTHINVYDTFPTPKETQEELQDDGIQTD